MRKEPGIATCKFNGSNTIATFESLRGKKVPDICVASLVTRTE